MDIELLKIYYDEWKFRQQSIWKRMTLFFVVIFFVSTLPITINNFQNIKLPAINPVLFPICGIALSLFYLWFFLAEGQRITAIDILIRNIIKNNFPKTYTKIMLPNNHKLFTCRMVTYVPIILSCFEIGIAICMIILIQNQMI